MISSFIEENKMMAADNSIGRMSSSILNKEIPILQETGLLKDMIDKTWAFIVQSYNDPRILNANNLYRCNMSTIWNILEDKAFLKKNDFYSSFMTRFENPIFKLYRKDKNIRSEKWELWKRAFFIAYLSADEIELIIEQYLRRDYTFELDLR